VITLTVTTYNGAPSADHLSAGFDELGGTIGRADTNQLVLPDPDRAISRVHAQVLYRNGSYAIVDRGSNPISVNGRPLGSGAEQVLRDGDQVQVGGYVLRVQVRAAAAAAPSNDPFADLLGPAAAAPARPGAPAAPFDPLARANKQEHHVPGTMPGAYMRSAPPPAATAPASAAGGIPDDWDPFAPDAPAPAAAPRGRDPLNLGLDVGAAAPAALIPGLTPASAPASDSLDALFGLKPGGSSNADPLGGSLLSEAAALPNMAAHADPLRSLQAVPQASAQAAPDNFSDLNRAFQLPPSAPLAPSAPIAPPPPFIPAEPPAAAPKTGGPVLSWDAAAEGHTVIRPSANARPPEPASVPTPIAAPVAASFAPPLAPPMSPPKPAAPAVSASNPASAGTNSDLLAAFRQGLNMPGLAIDSLTPELMTLVGQIVREAAAGTVDLLVARAALKREVRAEATMIVARENNPLKFSPSAEAALQHLLAPPLRGFMPAAPAMRDAYNDLRAHQFGFIAGMRAALAGVLERFDPSQLEGQLTKVSTLKSLLPGSRKAAMWDVFTEHYSRISTEAEDDFHSLFGRAFLKAYEEHIAQLERDQP
jgi:FHA domain-containing protein